MEIFEPNWCCTCWPFSCEMEQVEKIENKIFMRQLLISSFLWTSKQPHRGNVFDAWRMAVIRQFGARFSAFSSSKKCFFFQNQETDGLRKCPLHDDVFFVSDFFISMWVRSLDFFLFFCEPAILIDFTKALLRKASELLTRRRSAVVRLVQWPCFFLCWLIVMMKTVGTHCACATCRPCDRSWPYPQDHDVRKTWWNRSIFFRWNLSNKIRRSVPWLVLWCCRIDWICQGRVSFAHRGCYSQLAWAPSLQR